MGVTVRQLPSDHDPTDLGVAMREARDLEAPALGVYFSSERPTLGDALNKIAEQEQESRTPTADVPEAGG